MKKSLYYYYLFAALLSLSLAIFLGSPSGWGNFGKPANNNQVATKNFLQKIASTLQKEITTSETQLKELRELVTQSKNINFTQLSYTNKYAIFIYNDDQLLYWTDYKYFIDKEDINGKFAQQCIENSNGFFIINKEYIVVKAEKYQIVSVIPLYLRYQIDNQYIKSYYNQDIFPENIADITLSLNDEEGQSVKSADGRYLFSVIMQNNDSSFLGTSRKNAMIFFAGLTILFSMLLIRLNVVEYLHQNKVWFAFFTLIIALLSLRILIVFFDVPFQFSNYKIIDWQNLSETFFFSDSLGDFLLNTLVVCSILAFGYLYYHKLLNIKALVSSSLSMRIFISILLCLLTYTACFFQFYVFENLYFRSQISLDITLDLDFDIDKLLCLAIFILSAVIYFFIAHVVSRLLILLNRYNYQVLISMIYAAIIFVFGFAILDTFDFVIFAINTTYLIIITFLRFPLTVRVFNYNTYIYLFLVSVASALLGAYSIYTFENTMDTYNKKEFASKLLVENDKLAEFLLHDVSKKIKEDAMIQTRMMAFSANDLIVQKIKKYYLSDYFEKYDVNVLLFNGNGEPLNADIGFDSLFMRFDSTKYKTEYVDLFFVADVANNIKRYLQFTEIYRQDIMVGKVLIDLKLKKIIPNSVYPSLFVDKKFAAYNEDTRYSYAIYRNSEQLYTFGDFSYVPNFLKYFESGKTIIKTKDEDNDKNYRHFLLKGEGKSVFVSSETYPFKSIISNFSFLFIVLLLYNLALAIIYSLAFRRINWNLNFSARIQIYINLAFFLPLVFVSILVVSILNSVNIEETRKNYIEKAENVSINLGASLENLRKGYINREKLLNPLVEVAKLTQTDINVFTKTGRLLVASQPFIYENSFLSELINPQALAKIIEQKQNKVMLTESIGSLEYNSVYVGVKSYETGEILGIIGIPFFESQRKSEQQIIEILSTIMNVFTFTFIILLVASYFASRLLVKPLQLITQKIKRTTLGNNEPLTYKSEDEIGLLVGAYNQMLLKLEESKEALSRSEKESAWREMAKQVAHEIKNPLTPMKLTLQHLQRIISLERPQLLNSINSMIGQIDTLSDIATSFASFANMPIPKNEKFEMGEIVRETVTLYENNENAIITLSISEGKYFVVGDRKLMSRTITNLIINGIQAVANEKTPQIDVSLSILGKEKVIVEVKDNGLGIPEDIGQKVFLPNFTTKHTGSGIGLALAKRGIEHANGSIWFETEEGIGTSFFVEMPLIIVHKL